MNTLLTRSLLALSLTACVDQPETELGSDEQGIINGDEIPSANSGIPQIQNLGSGCSGTLLDNNWVLTAAHCADSYFDHKFETDGNTVIKFPGWAQQMSRAVATDSYGRAVLAGGVSDGTTTRFAVARVNGNGAPDPYFASGAGRVTTLLPNTSSAGATAVAVDGQNRIVVGGWARSLNGTQILAVARYTMAGALDTTFAGDGVFLLDVPGLADEWFRDLAIDHAGRIVIAADGTGTAGRQITVVRLTANGALDNTWNGRGWSVIDFASTADESAHAIAVDSTDRVIVTGEADDQVALARFRTDGLLDTAFDGDGKVLAPNGKTHGRDVAIDKQDRIVVVIGDDAALGGMQVGRFLTSGALDTTFGTSGWAVQKANIGFRAFTGSQVVTDAQNRVIVGGYGLDFDNYRQFALTRFSAAGAPDATFNTLEGAVASYQTDASGVYDATLNGLALDPNGNLYASVSGSAVGFGIAHVLAQSDMVDAWPGLKVMMGTQTVQVSKVFRAPGYDAALLKLASPLAINGNSTTYKFNGFYTGAPSTLVGKTLNCYGYGYNSYDNTGFGTLRTADLKVTSATSKEYTMATNADGQIIYHGDSGGPCYVDDGTKWALSGLHSYGGGGSSVDVGSTTFSTWVGFIRQYY